MTTSDSSKSANKEMEKPEAVVRRWFTEQVLLVKFVWEGLHHS